MTSCKVMIAKAAYTDLEQLIRYISDELAEPQTALKLTNKLESAILSLSEMPERGRYVQDEAFASRGIRRILVENYIIFYNVDMTSCTVNIIRILYAKRNWTHIL